MTLLKIFTYNPIENKKTKLKPQEVKSKSGSVIEKKSLGCNSHQENLEVEIPTQIVINKTNIAQPQWHKYLNSKQYLHKSHSKTCNKAIEASALKSSNTLLNLAQVNFEEKLIETFIDRLSCLSSLQTELINILSVSYPKRTITIVSSFIISEKYKQLLVTTIREKIAFNAEIEFETKKEFISGIQLRDYNYKISWDLKHYLTEINWFKDKG